MSNLHFNSLFSNIRKKSYLWFFLLVLLQPMLNNAASKTLNEEKVSRSYQIKAGFLLHFTSFIDWPDNELDILNICIVGKDPFGSYLDDMVSARGVNRKGIKVEVKRLAIGFDISDCQLIFLTKESATPDFWNLIPDSHSILLVSEYSQFINKGGLVNFYNDKKHVRIEINMEQVEKSELKISSELLKLSRIIKTAGN